MTGCMSTGQSATFACSLRKSRIMSHCDIASRGGSKNYVTDKQITSYLKQPEHVSQKCCKHCSPFAPPQLYDKADFKLRYCYIWRCSVADPGFPGGGTHTQTTYTGKPKTITSKLAAKIRGEIFRSV